MLDICPKWEGLSSFYFIIEPGAIFFVVPYVSVGYRVLNIEAGTPKAGEPGGLRGREAIVHSWSGETVSDCQLDPVWNRSIGNILQVSKVSKVSIVSKYRRYLARYLGIDVAQVPRYLQSIEYRPGTSSPHPFHKSWGEYC